MILQQMSIVVSTHGELVLLRVGNVEWKLEHDIALRMAAWMWIEARDAKRAAHDDTRRFTVAGLLTNATPVKARSLSRLRDAEWLRARDITVSLNRTLVAVRIGRHTMELPYDEARRLAIWLRMHGKEARNHAQDNRRWSEIGKLAAVEAGENPMAASQH
jgi:hypothetical protein